MTPNILLFFLPAIAYAKISVQITDTEGLNGNVTYNGTIEDIITVNEVDPWKINEDRLLNAVRVLTSNGLQPEPDPNDDISKTLIIYGKQQDTKMRCATRIRRIIAPTSAQFLVELSSSGKPTNTTQTTISPSTLVVDIKYNSNVTRVTKGLVRNSWNDGGAHVNTRHVLEYDVDFHLKEPEERILLSFSHPWRKKSQTEKTVTDICYTVGPADKSTPGTATYVTHQTKKTAVVVVNYVAKLQGGLACNFDNRHYGHRYYPYEINRLLKVNHSPQEITFTETITIDLDINAEVGIRDDYKP